MLQLNVRNRMLVMLLIPVTITIVMISVISHYYARESLAYEIKQSLTAQKEEYAGQILRWQAEKEGMVDFLAFTLTTKLLSFEDTKQILRKTKEANTDLINVTIAYPDKRNMDAIGTVFTSDFDATKRDWYNNALACQTVVFKFHR